MRPSIIAITSAVVCIACYFMWWAHEVVTGHDLDLQVNSRNLSPDVSTSRSENASTHPKMNNANEQSFPELAHYVLPPLLRCGTFLFVSLPVDLPPTVLGDYSSWLQTWGDSRSLILLARSDKEGACYAAFEVVHLLPNEELLAFLKSLPPGSTSWWSATHALPKNADSSIINHLIKTCENGDVSVRVICYDVFAAHGWDDLLPLAKQDVNNHFVVIGVNPDPARMLYSDYAKEYLRRFPRRPSSLAEVFSFEALFTFVPLNRFEGLRQECHRTFVVYEHIPFLFKPEWKRPQLSSETSSTDGIHSGQR